MKFALGMPCNYGRNRIETTSSVVAITRDLLQRGFEFDFWVAPGMWIDYARNSFCQEALTWGADWIGMMDDDVSCLGDTFYKMIENNVDICSPLMHIRRFPYNPVIFDYIEKENAYKSVVKLKKGLVKVDGVGAGIILIRASILKSMMQPWFAMGQKFGEDLYFCSNARKHKFGVYYDGRLQGTHYGDPEPVNTNNVMKVPGCLLTLEEANA